MQMTGWSAGWLKSVKTKTDPAKVVCSCKLRICYESCCQGSHEHSCYRTNHWHYFSACHMGIPKNGIILGTFSFLLNVMMLQDRRAPASGGHARARQIT